LGYPGCLIHSLRGISRVSSRIFHNLSDHWRATNLILGFPDYHHLILGFCPLLFLFNFGFSGLPTLLTWGYPGLPTLFTLGYSGSPTLFSLGYPGL